MVNGELGESISVKGNCEKKLSMSDVREYVFKTCFGKKISEVKVKLLKKYSVGKKLYKVHIIVFSTPI